MVEIEIGVLPKKRWDAICRDCTGSIGSLVELLQGKLSKNVMERVCRAEDGLFPSPDEIELRCSCPDWADMCKHVAAVLYGIGARLDQQPELLFRLHGVDEKELIAHADVAFPLAMKGPAAKVLVGEDLSELFGLDMGASPAAKTRRSAPIPTEAKRATKRSRSSKTTAPAKMAHSRVRDGN